MGIKKIILLSISVCMSFVSCHDEPVVSDVKDKPLDLDDSLDFREFQSVLSEESKPIVKILMGPNEERDVLVPVGEFEEVGVVIKNGYYFSKKYSVLRSPALRVSNKNPEFPDEGFGTSFSSQSEFSSVNGEIKLEVKNQTAEHIELVLFVE